YYRKALTCRNSNFGIGALAYLRRVVEDEMNRLLELTVDVAKTSSGLNAEKLSRMKQVRNNKRFDDKVEFAATILPPHLRPGGHNPFDILHDLPSEGIHALSEAECIEIFDRIRHTFEHLFKNLTFNSEETKMYLRDLSQLSQRK